MNSIKDPNCELCPLRGRPKLVLNTSNVLKGGLAIIGEAPGRTEIVKQQPFIGQSGKILRTVLEKLDISNFYITNTVLCNPENNATPTQSALDACLPRLLSELEQVQPKGILLVGATALHDILPQVNAKISSVRGQIFESKYFPGIPVIATFHPAYLLRHPDGFRDFVQDIQKMKPLLNSRVIYHRSKEPQINVKLLKTPDDITDILPELLDSTRVALDLETLGFDYETDKIWSLMFLADNRLAYAIVDPESKPLQLLETLKSVLENSNVKWIGHNAKFDSKFLRTRLGITWPYIGDTMLLHYSLDERSGGHGLKYLATYFFNTPDYDVSMKAYMDAGLLTEAPLNEMLHYQALDCFYTWKLWPILRSKAVEDNVLHVHDNLLVPFSHSLEQVELNGFRVDREYLKSLTEIEEHKLMVLSQKIEQMASSLGFENFNPRSPQQVKKIFASTGINLRNTSEEMLSSLPNNQLARTILAYRHFQKLSKTYVEPLLAISEFDGRIHSEFLIHGTRTGRLSSRNPNLQNIPVDIGPLIERAFVASPGYYLVNSDFSQLELRVAAWYSHDEALLDAYRKNQDIHRIVAAAMYKIKPEEVTKLQRKAAKFVDFGILYGRGAQSLAEGELQCSLNEAQRFLENFLEQFPGLAHWMTQVEKQALRDGYLVTATGRKRRFPLIMGFNRHKIIRQAVNTPIQSLASDITQTALRLIQSQFSDIVVVSTIHDSIMFEIRKERVDELPAIRHVIETAADTLIEPLLPFPASIEIGERWGELVKVPR